MTKEIKECFERAKEVLKQNEIKLGIKAGGRYPDFWIRDALISTLGMSYSGDEELLRIARKILENVPKFQKKNGQLPNKISQDGKRVCFGEGGCVDSSLWYPISILTYFKNTGDKKFVEKVARTTRKALAWAFCLDVNNDFLLEIPEAGDWNDWLIRSGRVLYDNVLFYKALS